jgi:PilZ domain
MSAARHFIARSPRYVFQTEDSSLVRFAPMETKGISQRAVIQDLSESGLSFTLPITEPSSSLPEEGSPLKVEFPIPGRTSIACFATVTRVEQRSEWVPEWGDRGYHLVALQFRHLPTLHLRAIQRGLEGRVSYEHEFDWKTVRRTHQVAFAGMTIAMLACCFALTLSAHGWVQALGL